MSLNLYNSDQENFERCWIMCTLCELHIYHHTSLENNV